MKFCKGIYRKQVLTKKPSFEGFFFFVESEGFEPSSKRRVFKLSTCLFLGCFSIQARTRTPKTWT